MADGSDTSIPRGDPAAWAASRWSELVPVADSIAAETAIRFMRVAHDLGHSHVRALRPWNHLGVNNIDDFRTLGVLRHVSQVGLRIQYIAEHLGTEASTVSSRVARFEKHGLIVRFDDPADRRASRVRLIEGQKHVVDEIYLALVSNHQRFFEHLSAEEHQALAQLLGKP